MPTIDVFDPLASPSDTVKSQFEEQVSNFSEKIANMPTFTMTGEYLAARRDVTSNVTNDIVVL